MPKTQLLPQERGAEKRTARPSTAWKDGHTALVGTALSGCSQALQPGFLSRFTFFQILPGGSNTPRSLYLH